MGKRLHVTTEVRRRVEAKVDECIEKAEAHYRKIINTPDIRYELTGTVAGQAHHAHHHWYIDLNSVLLMENVDAMIANTVPHEMAHMICAVVYPETLAPRGMTVTSTGRVRREKREVHGPRFYEVCDVLGMDEAARTHNYDVSRAKKNIDTSTVTYVCMKCDKEFEVSRRRHTFMLNGTRKYKHKCGGPIFQKGSLKPMMVGTQPVLISRLPPLPGAGKQGPTNGKIGACWALFKRWHERYSRKQMIAVFVNECDCTPACASTYYASCQKLYREGYL